MATSGSKSISVTKSDTLKFSWSLSSQSVSGNYSKVSWKLQLISGSYGAIYSSASKKWSVKVNGKSYSGSNTIGIGNNSTKTLASGSTTINHNSDGKKTFSYSFSQTFDITFNGSHVGTKSGSGSGTLTTIPRASSMSVPNITIGSSGTLTISKASSSFKHSVSCDFGGYHAQIAVRSTASSFSFTPPMEWCNALPSGTSGTATYKVSTFTSDETFIATKTYTKTLYIPSSVVPTISGISHAETSLSSGWSGVYVKTKSKIQFRISCAGAYGSSIKSIITKFDGQTLSGTPSPSANCNSAGAVPYTVTVTDSRGRTASKSGTINVMDYNPPNLITFNAFRCDENGKANDNGDRLSITKRFSITALNNINTNKWRIEYKIANDSSYSLLKSGTGYSVNDTYVTESLFNVDKAYELKITVEDSFNVISKAIDIPTAFTLIDYNKTGKGISFGKVSEKDGFVVDMDLIEFENSINVNKHIYLPTTGYLCNKSEVDGATFIVAGMTTEDQIILGYSSRDLSRGVTYLDGHNIYERSNGIINMLAGTCGMELGHGNEINFSSSSSSICFGYRSIGGTTPSVYAFGNGASNAYGGTIGCTHLRSAKGGMIEVSSANNLVIGDDNPVHESVRIYASSVASSYARFYIFNRTTSQEMMAFTSDSTGQFMRSEIVRDRLYSYSQDYSVRVTTNGVLGRAGSSSRKYKKDIISIEENLEKQKAMTMMVDDETEPIINPDGLYDIPVMQYKYIDGYLSGDDPAVGIDIVGIMAEDVAEYSPTACISDDNGEPEAWSQEPVVVGLLYLVQEQKKEIEELKEIVKGLTA